MEKTILQWYEGLPEPVRSRAIHAHKTYRGEQGTRQPVEDLPRAIKSGFVWSYESQEGYKYWNAVHNFVRDNPGKISQIPNFRGLLPAGYVDVSKKSEFAEGTLPQESFEDKRNRLTHELITKAHELQDHLNSKESKS